jgi:hypothetical protein
MTFGPATALARRAALTALAGMAAMIGIGRGAGARPSQRRGETRMRAVDDAFRRRLPLWQVERRQFALSSDTHDSWKGPHGKAIIGLGPAVIPHLIAQLRGGDFFFNVPLASITGVDITNGEYASEQANAALWLAWWDGGKP